MTDAIRYTLHGLDVPRDGCYRIWTNSRTYRRAAQAWRIWLDAERALRNGQPVPEAARAHLKEAGIVMIAEPHKHPAADTYSLHGQGAQ